MDRSFNASPLLLAFGLLAFALAGLSIADMFVPRPYDGVVLDADSPRGLTVREVIAKSGADRAGIRKGDEIRGIGRLAVNDAVHAGRLLNNFRIGEEVTYLVKSPGGPPVDRIVRLDRRSIVDGTYVYSTALGFSFFFVGLFVFLRQPALRVSQVFFLLCGFFLLFLVCRMRPPSYSSIDTLVLGIGTLAFLLLPATFLHFCLIFPRPALLDSIGRRASGASWTKTAVADAWRYGWPLLYLLPSILFVLSFLAARSRDEDLVLISGAPAPNWVLMALYMFCGLAALGGNARMIREARQRRGVVLVLVGSLFGLCPFLISCLLLAASQYSTRFFFFGIMPLVLVPVTFTYAIVRFQLLNIQVILRRSILYTVTTAMVTGLYAGGIATFNAFFHDTSFAASPYFPIILALAIVLLFEPLRRRMQEFIDRYFFAGRSRLQKAMLELGDAMAAQVDLQPVIQELVERLPQILDLRFAALYLNRGSHLARMAGPESLPPRLPSLPEMRRAKKRSRLMPLAKLSPATLLSPEVPAALMELEEAGVEVVGGLASPRRYIGLVVLSEKRGQMSLEADELELLGQLLDQVSLALETSLLLEERTQQAELERELEIAATIQAQLLPSELSFADGWRIAAVCRPARIVGGDFFSQLPGENGRAPAVIFGDVSGKSVSGALMMMAAHEALHALAMTARPPAELFSLTNRRLYGLGKRSFVALGYFSATADGRRLSYLVAGQPAPLVRRTDGSVHELPLPNYRIPVGALADSDYRALEVDIDPGDLVVGYSDGIIEARSPAGEFFGVERLVEILRATDGGPQDVVDTVLEAVETFTGEGLQYDDLTLVAVDRERVSGTTVAGEDG